MSDSKNKNQKGAASKEAASAGSEDMKASLIELLLEKANAYVEAGNQLAAYGIAIVVCDEAPENEAGQTLFDEVQAAVEAQSAKVEVVSVGGVKKHQRAVQFTANFATMKKGDVAVYPSQHARSLVNEGVATYYDMVSEEPVKDTHPEPKGVSDGFNWGKMNLAQVQDTVNGLHDLDVLKRGSSRVKGKEAKEYITNRVKEITAARKKAEEEQAQKEAMLKRG